MKSPQHLQAARRRVANLATLVGCVFALLGLLAGLFFGVLRPALASESPLALPSGLVAGTAVIALSLLLAVALQVRRRVRPKRAPDEDVW